MSDLQSYVKNAFYDIKQNLTGQDFILGSETESWIQRLRYNETKPKFYIIRCQPVLEGETFIVVLANEPVKVYRRDVLKFNTVLVVITEDTLIDTEPTILPILPLVGNILDEEFAATYGMIPILAVAEGSTPDETGTDADAYVNDLGLYDASRTVRRDGSINISGDMYKDDPSLALLQDLGKRPQNLYYQSRYTPYTVLANGEYTQGSGPGAYEVVVALTDFEFEASGQKFVNVSYTLNFGGSPILYKPLPNQRLFNFRYCPLETGGIYTINFIPTIQQDRIKYCPLTPPY